MIQSINILIQTIHILIHIIGSRSRFWSEQSRFRSEPSNPLSLFQESESKNNYISKGHIYKDLYISKLLTHLYNLKENTNIRFKKKMKNSWQKNAKRFMSSAYFGLLRVLLLPKQWIKYFYESKTKIQQQKIH